MNIKNLRRNYDVMTMKERLILLELAELRDDESEIKAIVSASPKENWLVCDFVEAKNKLQTVRLIRLAQRLKHLSEAFLFLHLSERAKEEKGEYLYNSACLEAYFYCVNTDVDKAILNEFGLDNEALKEKEREIFDLDFIELIADKLLRNVAFSETEARDFIQTVAIEKGFGKVILGFTFENELNGLRQALKEHGLL